MLHATPLAVTLHADRDIQQVAYDVIILLVVVVNVAAGVRQGLIRRAIGLAGVFGAAASATWIGNSVVATFAHNGLIPDAWGFVAIFLIVLVMIEVLSLLYSDQIDHTASLVFDRVAGGLMGLVAGILQIGVLVVVILAVGDAQPGPGRDVPAGHTVMSADVRTATLGSLWAQADGGLRGVFTPVLPDDLPGHLASASSEVPAKGS